MHLQQVFVFRFRFHLEQTQRMYADRVETGTRRSVKERLDGNFLTDSTRQHKVTGKRLCVAIIVVVIIINACELFIFPL